MAYWYINYLLISTCAVFQSNWWIAFAVAVETGVVAAADFAFVVALK